ncbi:hypothetical protein I6E81_09055 [Salinibacterium sp. NG22]|uniref:hypothetical protein n=1 Tax=Salinibacterium sp. NG22 TaxID=2792040 RepID=UPI0018CF855F|nr:hypothetical protein [Salinibacterium sp. NG22]MBH0110314.1 hypothetical protein [Salinibacterium sp. NG22]
MDRTTELLDASAPRRELTTPAITAALSDVVESSTLSLRYRRPAFIAGISALLIGTSTAAAAAAGLLFPVLPPSLFETGEGYDLSWNVVITTHGQEFACSGGYTLQPVEDQPGFDQEIYDDAKLFLQTEDWSSVRPDPAFMDHETVTAKQTAEILARSIKTQVMAAVIAEFESRGTPLLGISGKGIDECTL